LRGADVPVRVRTWRGSLLVLGLMFATTAGAQAAASVSLSISPSSLTWTVNDFVNQFLAPDNGPISVTGSMSSGTGNGTHTETIGVAAPAQITGSHTTNIIPISAFSMTCSGVGNSPAPAYAGAHAGLVASSTTTCATWSVAKNTAITVNFSLQLFLDDRTFPADSYTSAGFSIVGSAT
jgi:hypothetical protein